MYDPQLFQKEVLANGVELYTHIRTTPVVYVSFLSELSLSLTGDSAPQDGHLHLLEHLMMERTEGYEGRGALREILERRGFKQNATTGGSGVEFWIGGRADDAAAIATLLADRVLRPVFLPEDIEREVPVIQNERAQRARFYPGSNPSGKWFQTEVLNGAWYPLERIFGSDADLAAATPERLAQVHATLLSYGTPKVVAVLPDESALATLREAFGGYARASSPALTWSVDPLSFTGPGPFEARFSTIKTLSHTLERIYAPVTRKQGDQLWFLMHMLGNSDLGTVYKHFRHELSWIYSLNWWCNNSPRGLDLGFEFPLEQADRIAETTRLLPQLIASTLADDAHFQSCRERLRGTDAFGYQRASDVIDGAIGDLQSGDPIRTQAMRDAWYDELASRELRVALGEQYLDFSQATHITLHPDSDGS